MNRDFDFSGGISAGLTTPLDVAKTRIMLAEAGSVEAKGFVSATLRAVYRQKGNMSVRSFV